MDKRDPPAWAEGGPGRGKAARAAVDASSTRRDQLVSVPFARMAGATAEVRLGNLDVGLGEATAVLTASDGGPVVPMVLVRAKDLLRVLSGLPGSARSPLARDYRELVASLTPASA